MITPSKSEFVGVCERRLERRTVAAEEGGLGLRARTVEGVGGAEGAGEGRASVDGATTETKGTAAGGGGGGAESRAAFLAASASASVAASASSFSFSRRSASSVSRRSSSALLTLTLSSSSSPLLLFSSSSLLSSSTFFLSLFSASTLSLSSFNFLCASPAPCPSNFRISRSEGRPPPLRVRQRFWAVAGRGWGWEEARS